MTVRSRDDSRYATADSSFPQFSDPGSTKAISAFSRRGFSLVEVVMAIGLVVFVMLSLAALLPLGVKSNQISTDESRGSNILTALEADLRNSASTSGTSAIFGLPPPYRLAPPNTNLVFNTPGAGRLYTAGLSDSETVASSSDNSRYQVSVIYVNIPPPNSLAPMEARLIVNWPCHPAGTVTDLTDPSKVAGFVEAYVTFPAP